MQYKWNHASAGVGSSARGLASSLLPGLIIFALPEARGSAAHRVESVWRDGQADPGSAGSGAGISPPGPKARQAP